jgi:hypothetical protein
MPPDEKLPDAVVADFVRWIEMGAPDPREDTAARSETTSDPNAGNEHWAFVRPERRSPPSVKNAAWSRADMDRFVLARLEQAGLEPAPDACPHTLVRRVYMDLIGLPPTADEAEGFQTDPSDEAFVQMIDGLLASKHFGERWGRHWLDVARYADTKGYVFNEDRNYPKAYTYRDWVIQAFNDDMPYDEFLLAQIAGDQIAPDEPQTLAAMGFLTLGRRFLNNKHDIIDDRIDVVCRGTMALTVTCARCHDHKYDPIPTADYYSLYGVFASSHEPKDDPSPLRLVDAETPSEPVVFIRGNSGSRGQPVPRQFLRVLAGDARRPFQQGSGRLELAQAISSPKNPLTARVLVNRVWVHLFGRGLVRTPSDFGTRSDPPSHPDLLDYLAASFIEDGWSIKRLIRRIVLSRTYRQASSGDPAGEQLDPENRLLWRMNRRRVDLEAMRDSVLAVSGQLDKTVGGPSVRLTTQPFATRRTVYGFIDRQNLPGMFRTFDFASPDTHAPGRFTTTVPQQALFLMNSPFVQEQAEHLVARPDVAGVEDQAQRVRQLYRIVHARDPSPEETALGLEFIGDIQSAGNVSVVLSEWQYGYGQFDKTTQQVTEFKRLPHWTGSAWQGGAELPDPKIGWVILHADGGHPGNDQKHAAVRRWTAPGDGTVAIAGTLKHPSDKGDGVRARVVSSRSGVVGHWEVHHGEVATHVETLNVQSSDTIDFLTDCRDGPSFDGFGWIVTVRMEPSGKPMTQSNSASDFHGPHPKQLGAWAQYAQVLLLSNEFSYVD